MRLSKLNDFFVDNNSDEFDGKSDYVSNNLIHLIEIQYILNNEQIVSSIVTKILNIKKSHEAYSHSKRFKYNAIDDTHGNININTANQLIIQITSNDSGSQTARKRVNR